MLFFVWHSNIVYLLSFRNYVYLSVSYHHTNRPDQTYCLLSHLSWSNPPHIVLFPWIGEEGGSSKNSNSRLAILYTGHRRQAGTPSSVSFFNLKGNADGKSFFLLFCSLSPSSHLTFVRSYRGLHFKDLLLASSKGFSEMLFSLLSFFPPPSYLTAIRRAREMLGCWSHCAGGGGNVILIFCQSGLRKVNVSFRGHGYKVLILQIKTWESCWVLTLCVI